MVGTTPVQRQMPISQYAPVMRYSQDQKEPKIKVTPQSDLRLKNDIFLRYVSKIEEYLKRHPDKIKALHNGIGLKEVLERHGSRQRQILMARYGVNFLDTVVQYLREKYRSNIEYN